jgi:hypothetical protein
MRTLHSIMVLRSFARRISFCSSSHSHHHSQQQTTHLFVICVCTMTFSQRVVTVVLLFVTCVSLMVRSFIVAPSSSSCINERQSHRHNALKDTCIVVKQRKRCLKPLGPIKKKVEMDKVYSGLDVGKRNSFADSFAGIG